MLQKSGYEADDWAASLVVLNSRLPEPNKMTLVTVDSDWMGLVSPDVDWFCMKGWKPRLRSYGSDQFKEWVWRRLDVNISEPKDIWLVKQAQGDKSDNLPKKGPIEVIDLLAPPKEFRLWDKPKEAAEMTHLLTDALSPQVPDVAKAVAFLQSSGIPLFINPENHEKVPYA